MSLGQEVRVPGALTPGWGALGGGIFAGGLGAKVRGGLVLGAKVRGAWVLGGDVRGGLVVARTGLLVAWVSFL